MTKQDIESISTVDRDNLPKQYPEMVQQPYYKGDGMHNIVELEKICRDFTEYTHQQAVIKQNISRKLTALRLYFVDVINKIKS